MGDRQRGWWWKQSADGAKGALTFEGDGDSGECCGHFFILERVTCGMEDVLEGRTWEAGGWVPGALLPIARAETGSWWWQGSQGGIKGVCEAQEIAGLLAD